MDDAIAKAEEQVEKFTEMAKETKVLLYDFFKILFCFITRFFVVVLFLLVEVIEKHCGCRLVCVFSTNQS